ncbi:AAA family ATPase [soil metagenome]
MQLADVVTHVLASPARLGSSRLVCIDGRAGAGKTEYAAELAAACAAASSTYAMTLHMDDLYEGWAGLPTASGIVSSMLLEPWSRGLDASPARWNWEEGRRTVATSLPLTPLVILEGVGSYARRYDDLVTTLVWLQCPEPVRRSRALGRDGVVFAPHWDRWARDEERVHAREGTRVRADVTVHTAVSPHRTSTVTGPVCP